MNIRKSIATIALIGVSLLALAGCAGPLQPGTKATITPASVAVAGTIVGEGHGLKCEPSLWTITLNGENQEARWQSSNIDIRVEQRDGKQDAVIVTVHGDVNVKAAIVRYSDLANEAGATTVPAPVPTAVNWPYDSNGVEATFVSFTFSQTNPIGSVDLCVGPELVEAE